MTDQARKRRWPLILVCCILAILAAGCTSGSNTAGRGKTEATASAGSTMKTAVTRASRKPHRVVLVKRVYRATARAGSARVWMKETESGLPAHPPGGKGRAPSTITITGRGKVSFARGEAEVEISSAQLPRAGKAEIRQIGYTLYEKLPKNAKHPSGKSWIKLNLKKLAQKHGAYLAQLASGQQNDPVHQLDYLKGVSSSVRKLGKEKVRGVPTTHYRAVIDLNKAARKNPQGRSFYAKLQDELGASRLPVEVWVDKKDRVRRYEASVPIKVPRTAPGKGSGKNRGSTTSRSETTARIRIATEYYDFGVPVHVEPPPPGQTLNVTRLPSG